MAFIRKADRDEVLEARGTTPATIDQLLSVADLFVAGEVGVRTYFSGRIEDATAALRRRNVSGTAVKWDGD